MAFYGYNGDTDDSQWISYNDNITYNHDLFPPQSSSSRCSYDEFDMPNSIQNCYDYNQSSKHYYSVYGYNEPILIQYEQSPSSYVSESLYHNTTTYTTSYSTLEFNEPDFDEYDQTPYGGGYDIVQTYGKPLPPSVDICYPRSKPNRKDRRVTFAIPESIDAENVVGSKPQIAKGIEMENKPQIAKGIEMENNPNGDHKEDVIILEKKPIEVDDHNRVDEETNYDYGKGIEGNIVEVPTNYPYGSGLEAMDICDTIFGYWPCLEKMKKQNLANGKAVDDQGDPWTSAADYLFGSGYMYEEESRGNSQGHGYYFDGQHFDYSYK